MSNHQHCHPLSNEGSSTLSRLVQALNPVFFQLDERTTQDLIVEAQHFAQTLRFIDETNTQPEGVYWDRFWEVETITYLAIIAAKDTDELKRQYFVLDKALQQNETFRGSIKTASSSHTRYLSLLEYLQQMALSLELTYQKLVHIKHPLQSLLLNRIRKDSCCDQEELEGVLAKLIAFHKATNAKLPKNAYESFYAADKHWGVKNQIEYDAIPANPHFSQNDLRDLFNTLYNTCLVIKNAAQIQFDQELARMELPEEVEYRVVQPHIVLFLVFLRLFRHAQESLNELGGKHLDFYYEEILALKRRGEVPDEVYLIFELAKDFDQHLLQKGTLFSAGKDQTGQPLFYESIEDWVLRPAQVADIKTSWIDANCGGIHANPDVNKVYAQGIEKPNEQAKHWRSMGDDRNLPDGELGFAIASPQLILREGKRIIDVVLEMNNKPDLSWLKGREYLEVLLSSAESWLEPEYKPTEIITKTSLPNLQKGAFNVFFSAATATNKASLHFRIVLEKDDPPVVRLGDKLATETGIDTQWPIFKVIINPKWFKPCPSDEENVITAKIYEEFRNLSIADINIKVEAQEIRENLIIQTDQGVFNGTEKVFPFGPQPEKGHFFYIGSTEIFQKALTELKVKIDWIGAPEDFNDHYAVYNRREPFWDPKVRIDFIDKADATLSQPIEKIEYEKEDIQINARTLKLLGEVKDLTEGDNSLFVQYSKGQINGQQNIQILNGKYDVTIPNVPWDSEIELKETSRNYKFNIVETNVFFAYLLPVPAQFQSVRNYDANIKLEVEILSVNVDDLKIFIDDPNANPQQSIEKDSNGKYFLLLSDLGQHNLKITSTSHQPTILHRNHYEENELKKFSKISVKLYGSAPAGVTPPPDPVPDTEIKGKVFGRGGSANAISGAKVRASKPGQNIEITTLNDGSFTIPSGNTNGWTLQAFFNGARSSKTTSASGGNAYALQISDEITLTDFSGTLTGKVKSLDPAADDDFSTWGVKFYDPNDQNLLLGESGEGGDFLIAGVRQGIGNVKIRHEAFEDAEIDVIDNAAFDITLIPKPTYLKFQGKVSPFNNLSIGLEEVEVRLKGTGVKVETNDNGAFSIHVPTNVPAPHILSFSKPAFKTVEIDLAQLNNPVSGIKVILPEANPVGLLFLNELGDLTIRNNFDVAINAQNVKRDTRTQEFSQYSPTLKRGFVRFKLEGSDFFHHIYPKVLLQQTIALAKHEGENTPPPIPEAPYTPSTNFISVSYISSQTISGEENDQIDQFFHLLPFNGHKQISLEQTTPGIQLLYPYLPDDTLPLTTAYTPGNLFIGLSELQPGGTLALLFQIAEGSALEPEAAIPHIHWSYLSANNRWLPFKTGEILKDQTNNLTRSGLIQFSIPTDAVRENTMLDSAYYWLRGAAITTQGKTQALPSLQHIRAQVVQVRFKNTNNEPSHLAQPLPAETIADLVESRTAVKKIEQPLDSTGGRLPESMGMEYYQRISERLRHKDRAITIWDFEKMLLEKFTELHSAKCIPHTRYQPAEHATELAPGYVTLAVIPDLKKRKGEPWLEPRFNQGELEDMRQYLVKHANVFLAAVTHDQPHLQIVNPLYEPVDLVVNVVFHPNVDIAFHQELLQTELTHYLSPWLVDTRQYPTFGRKLERSAILQFIEERPYVDYVDVETYRIRMLELDVAGRPLVYEGGAAIQALRWRYLEEKICPSTARSILVAGKIRVGTITNKKTLPDLPAKKIPVASGIISSIQSQKLQSATKTATTQLGKSGKSKNK